MEAAPGRTESDAQLVTRFQGGGPEDPFGDGGEPEDDE